MNIKAPIEFTASDAEIKEFVDGRVNKLVSGGLSALIESFSSIKLDGLGDALKSAMASMGGAQSATNGAAAPSDPPAPAAS